MADRTYVRYVRSHRFPLFLFVAARAKRFRGTARDFFVIFGHVCMSCVVRMANVSYFLFFPVLRHFSRIFEPIFVGRCMSFWSF